MIVKLRQADTCDADSCSGLIGENVVVAHGFLIVIVAVRHIGFLRPALQHHVAAVQRTEQVMIEHAFIAQILIVIAGNDDNLQLFLVLPLMHEIEAAFVPFAEFTQRFIVPFKKIPQNHERV